MLRALILYLNIKERGGRGEREEVAKLKEEKRKKEKEEELHTLGMSSLETSKPTSSATFLQQGCKVYILSISTTN